jgi:glycosyltransferase involved in cell wall biosynthesis
MTTPGIVPKRPHVSVVMSVYNGERFLSEALESVLTQENCDFEVVVIEDGSTDSSGSILREYSRRDSRLIVHAQENEGLARALNRGFILARAPFVARLDQDDLAAPRRLERQRQFLREHADVAVVGGAVDFIDESGRPFSHWQYPLTDTAIRREFAHTTALVHSAVMVRKAAFERARGYRPIFTAALDLDLWLRLAERNEMANLPERVVSYRIHSAQMSIQHLECVALETIAARTAARVRAEHAEDPFDTLDRIDDDAIEALGVPMEDVTAAFVELATWLAKMARKAGDAEVAARLFDEAQASAQSQTGSHALLSHVYRQRARTYAEEQRSIRAKLSLVAALLAERVGRRRYRA